VPANLSTKIASVASPLLFFFAQRCFVQGIVVSGVKG